MENSSCHCKVKYRMSLILRRSKKCTGGRSPSAALLRPRDARLRRKDFPAATKATVDLLAIRIGDHHDHHCLHPDDHVTKVRPGPQHDGFGLRRTVDRSADRQMATVSPCESDKRLPQRSVQNVHPGQIFGTDVQQSVGDRGHERQGLGPALVPENPVGEGQRVVHVPGSLSQPVTLQLKSSASLLRNGLHPGQQSLAVVFNGLKMLADVVRDAVTRRFGLRVSDAVDNASRSLRTRWTKGLTLSTVSRSRSKCRSLESLPMKRQQ